MITRSIGKIVRGRCTPFQLFTASVLGACLGFVSDFSAAPGAIVFLGVLLAVVNANLFVAGLVGAGSYLASLALQPTTFAIGQYLLDGPTSDLFRRAINAPVLAYFGFERYVITGGLALGLGVGAVAGLLLAFVQTRLRARLAAAETGSQRYQSMTSKRWVRAATWLFLGKKNKRGYEALASKRVGNPVRIVGVVGVLGLGALAYGAHAILGSAYLQNTLQRGLERANGATVDLAALELDVAGGRFALEGLAVADRDELTHDLFRGLAFEADLSTRELLTKRLVVERVVVRRASTGERRGVPGERVTGADGAPPAADEEPPAEQDEVTLEEVLADAEVWRERLESARRLLARFSGDEDETGSGAGPAPGEDAGGESLRERLERRAALEGYGEIVATHLIDRAPRVQVQELVVDDFQLTDYPGQRFELRLENLSSAPSLLAEGPRASLRSADGSVELAFELGPRGSGATAAAPNAREARLAFALRGVAVDDVAAGVVVDGRRVVSGGTLDVELDGAYRDGGIDLPLNVTLHDTSLAIPGYAPTPVERFALPIGLRGPLDAPRVSVDDDALVDALVQAGKDELSRRVRAEVDARLAEATDELEGRLREQLDGQLEGGLEELGGGLKDVAGDAVEGGGLDGVGKDLLPKTPESEQKAADLFGGLLRGGRKQD